MDAFELNKIAGGVLFALLIFFAARTASDIIFTIPVPAEPGYDVAVAEDEGHEQEQQAAEAEVPLPKLLQEASAEKGVSVAKKCAACHTFEQGGANKVGPNLHGIVGRPVASEDGFAYSPAMQEFKGNQDTWTYEALNTFLNNPKGDVPGTKMAFAGVKSDTQRADLLLYLREESPDAPPLPEAAEGEAQQPAEGAPPAQDGAPAAQDDGSATQDGAPATQDDAPPAQDGAPAAQDGASATQDDAPAGSDDAPASEPAPASPESTPDTATEPPAAPAAPEAPAEPAPQQQ